MRSVVNKVRTCLDVQSFVVDLDDESCVDGEEAVGSDKGEAVRVRFHRFRALA